MNGVYWPRPVLAGPSPGPLPDRVDVAVIGAGFAGLSIAADLLAAAPGLRLAVVEAQFPGYGASGRNAGGVLPLAMLPWLLPGGAGRYDGRCLQKVLHERITAQMMLVREAHPAGEVQRTPMLLLGINRILAAGLDRIADEIAASGIGVERWTGARAGAAGASQAQLGVVLDAWTIQPAALVAGMADAVAAAGGQIHCGLPVARIDPTPGEVTVTFRDGRELRAGRVVVATGGYTAMLQSPDLPRAQVKHTYMRASPRLPAHEVAALGGTALFRSAPGPGMPYWRIHRDRLLFGGLDVRGLTPGPESDRLARAHRGVDRLLHRRLTGHRSKPAMRWGGPLYVTPTETPYIGPAAASNRIVYAVGFAGSGVALTLTCGPLVRDLVLGPTTADPAAVMLRAAMGATRIPYSATLKLAAGMARRLTRTASGNTT